MSSKILCPACGEDVTEDVAERIRLEPDACYDTFTDCMACDAQYRLSVNISISAHKMTQADTDLLVKFEASRIAAGSEKT